MSESFGADPVRVSVERYGRHLREQRETGALRMTTTGLLTATSGTRVPGHTFYGDHTAPARLMPCLIDPSSGVSEASRTRERPCG
jgi:hypothetical protein